MNEIHFKMSQTLRRVDRFLDHTEVTLGMGFGAPFDLELSYLPPVDEIQTAIEDLRVLRGVKAIRKLCHQIQIGVELVDSATKATSPLARHVSLKRAKWLLLRDPIKANIDALPEQKSPWVEGDPHTVELYLKHSTWSLRSAVYYATKFRAEINDGETSMSDFHSALLDIRSARELHDENNWRP